MIPPDDGRNHTIAISGRTYSASPSQEITVPSFDVPVLEANGWQVVSTTSDSVGESWAGRLRRLAIFARNGNPIESAPLTGSKPWLALTGAWAASSAVTAGQLRSNGGRAYLCVKSGTTAASGGPTGTAAGVHIADNTAAWAYYVGTIGDRVSNNGNVYEITTAGVPATSGGPTGLGEGIADGSITWAYVGKQTAPAISGPVASHNASYTKAYTITGAAGVFHADGTVPFRWSGGAPRTSVFGNDCTMQAANTAPSGGNLGGTYNAYYGMATFDFEGTKFELKLFMGNVNPVSVIVDGRYCDYILPSVNDSGTQHLIFDFTNVQSQTGIAGGTGRQRRRITIVTEQHLYQGVNCLPIDTISYPSVTDNFSCALIGDSQSTGTNTRAQDSFSVQLMHLLGLPDMMICGVGGTGMVNAGAATAYIGHAVSDLQQLNSFRPLGAIFIQSSQNDASLSASLGGAAAALFQALRAAFTEIPIFVIGNLTGGSIVLSTAQSTETIIANAVAAQQATGDDLIFFIPAANDPLGAWITGTGSAAAPNGSGNADADYGSDGTHLSASGHSLVARRIAAGVLNIIAKIP